MVHLRVVSAPPVADDVYRFLAEHPAAVNVVRLPDASRRPSGDVILCDVAREDTSLVIGRLRELGVDRDGSIAIVPISALLSDAGKRAERAAVGSPADAVVWEAVEAQTSESAALSGSFVAFMILATLIAAVGIIEDSIILIIGAMVVGPEFGPIAGLCVALVQRRGELALRSLTALAVGFPLAILASFGLSAILRATGSAPDELTASDHPATLFIAHPDRYSALIAVLAGVAGMLSLSTAKSGALVGVLISVTTIPAAANVGVASAYGNWSEARGAAAQLAVNVVCIVAAGVATLAVQRTIFWRRRRLSGSRR